MSSSRKWFYLLSLLIGLLYLIAFLIIYSHLISGPFLPILDVSCLILDSIFVASFILKDSLDERRIRKKSPPVGPSWIEHNPLAWMIFLQLLISFSIKPVNEIITMVKLIIALLLIIDIFWDLWQDIRSKRLE